MRSDAAVPPELRTLWRQRARLLASNVATEGREHREIAHAAALIRQDYHDRFLVELLQNANDQALVGGVRDSTVVIVRSERLLAVSNGGQAVTGRNLERLSSFADSDKTGVLVGNKGVGFKAVYQVTDAPEVYSASADRATGSVFTDFGVGIALEQHPFEQQALRNAVEEDICVFFNENAGLAQALASRGIENPLDAVRPEFERVAGFKFPLVRDARDLTARLEDLRVPEDAQGAIRTLVVLPLRDQGASDDVARAIDRLVGRPDNGETGQAELALLFLSGVSRVVVIDHVRETRWTFSRTIHAGTPAEATLSVTEPTGLQRSTRFWLLKRDALAGSAPVVEERRRIVRDALREFDLEAWTENDPLPVTIALVMPHGERPSALGPPGRFCLGLPTQQPTGLPLHVDARFFATISRTGLDFALPYNAMLLTVAAELLDELLAILRGSPRLEERRAVTLALHRATGDLAARAFAPGGVADGEVVLGWDGRRFLARRDCRLPSTNERSLLAVVRDVITDDVHQVGLLPEEGLLSDAADVLESLSLPELTARLHPWLQRDEQNDSVIERAARLHRADGPGYWEGFTTALLSCFEVADLHRQTWLPVGAADLAAPSQRVFLPTSIDTQSDDEEVSNVPPRVATMIRLVDGTALRLREDGRALTKLAARLAKEALVRLPRKKELLEEALFPVLSSAVENDSLAFELFAQAVSWIASMRELSRKKLDCSRAYVPIADERGELAWSLASRSYLGEGWGLSPDHDRLLGAAYPGRRLVPFAKLRERFGLADEAVTSWRAAVELMGVSSLPRVVVYADRGAPLESYNKRLQVLGKPTLGEPAIDSIYQAYVDYLAAYGTRWTHQLPHNVNKVCWVDDLEVAARRQAIVDLVLMQPDHFFPHRNVQFGRVGYSQSHTVDAMWIFALRALGWPVLPGERGVGKEPVRVGARKLWRLPDGARRAAYTQLLNVVPHALAGASRLLGALGVPSVEDAPLERLLDALSELAARLDEERLHTRKEAQSLAIELYAQINARLDHEPLQRVPLGFTIPLLRNRRLERVAPSDAGVVVVFYDEPARARHIDGLERAFRVPVALDATIDRLYALFARSWGTDRVIRTSTAKVRVAFSSSTLPEAFLSWLQREYPHTEVAAELAALLTFGGERLVRAEPVSRTWKAFEKLSVEFGTFEDSTVATFYERAGDRMLVSATLDKHDVLAATWELAGARSRDLWAGYARALQVGSTRAFLHEREISDVEIIDVADAAGLHRAMSVQGLAPALQAARYHFVPGTTLDDAAAWLASIGDRPDDVARAFERPDLGGVLTAALGQRSPEGEVQVVRHLGVPWPVWQEAVLRRDGVRYVFAQSAQRFRRTREHLIAVVREVGAREPSIDLELLAAALTEATTAPVPDAVQFAPLDVARADEAALASIRTAIASFDVVSRAVADLPVPPWGDELPIPKDATQRGVRLFRDCSASAREIDATTSVHAVIKAAARLAPSFGEAVDASAILGDARLSARMRGEWAHVYAALLLLRPLLEAHAPETTKKLSAAQAFRDITTYTKLLQHLPDLPRTERDAPQPKQSVLGVELTGNELRADLLAGATGLLGAKIVAAAARGIDPSILSSSRSVLPPPGARSKATGGHSVGGGSSTGHARREPELVGDLGEAFVHEWLGSILGADYGPDCWISKSRERYGLPAGNDGLGFDFKVPDPRGLLFRRTAPSLHIEVKATSTDGNRPFPMSRAEWEEARRCHVEGDDLYVIVRVFEADTTPRIGDVIFDPFAAHGRGEIRLADRDLWVTVAPPRLVVDEESEDDALNEG